MGKLTQSVSRKSKPTRNTYTWLTHAKRAAESEETGKAMKTNI